MNKREQAQIILEVLDRRAPTNINWAMEEHWLKAIEEGLREVEKHEQKL
ncbi:MAG: hypothetical protein Q4C66_05270 [Lachnospiraceae bacterium]|nr:hypothetical protein [Lachnospiraceae bacterium]